MTLAVVAEPAPLKTNAYGVVRVGNTRVTLDTVIAVFKQGTTKTAKVKVAMTFLQQRQQQAQEIRKMNEARFDRQELRDRLITCKQER
ncbi:MAG: DUF433 domain-containing protein, partial [Microcoleus sp.]